jgi:hypothetical protein
VITSKASTTTRAALDAGFPAGRRDRQRMIRIREPVAVNTIGWNVAIGEYRSTSLAAPLSTRTVAMPASGPR